ncbi:MAG TPA: NUDIX domain-containing protein [Anaerolineae bacterium]|jgi:8-oxo-dGTP pyrophosphatase MutT (NUDIX family)|nr:NUDIX domain-containing protein [Anaerolineae bacterium]
MPTLDDLIPSNTFVGTSLILRRGDRFLYGIRPIMMAGRTQILELTGIGGGLEKEDESYTAGVRREAIEETGSDVTIVDCASTWIVPGRQQVEQITLTGDRRPAALVYRHHRTPPRQPWHPDNQGAAWLIVYLGELQDEPTPTMELPWLIWLSAAQVQQTAHDDVPLRDLLLHGAELITRPADPPPSPAAMTRLTDSQEALALALGERTVAVYESW